MRQGSSTLYFLLTDHLGSTAITATSSGGRDAELRYYPWGGTRYTYGTTPTSYRYTGQREAEVGLYFYGARFYDPQLGRFVSPDTIIPQQQGTQAWDRYAGMNNNPIKYTDPTGHDVDCSIGDTACLRRVMIEQAIETFDIDVSHISGFPEYDPGLVYDGETYPDSSAAIGPPAFSSAGHLGSTIGHENIHGIQIDEGRYYTGSSIGTALNEIEAIDWEISQANRFRLSDTDVEALYQARIVYYYVLDEEYQNRVDQGIYIIGPLPNFAPKNGGMDK